MACLVRAESGQTARASVYRSMASLNFPFLKRVLPCSFISSATLRGGEREGGGKGGRDAVGEEASLDAVLFLSHREEVFQVGPAAEDSSLNTKLWDLLHRFHLTYRQTDRENKGSIES